MVDETDVICEDWLKPGRLVRVNDRLEAYEFPGGDRIRMPPETMCLSRPLSEMEVLAVEAGATTAPPDYLK